MSLMVPGVRCASSLDQGDFDWSTVVDFDSENLFPFDATVKKSSVRPVRPKESKRSSREHSQVGSSHSSQTLVRKVKVCSGKNGAGSPCDERSREKAKTSTQERPIVLDGVDRREQRRNARAKDKADASWRMLDGLHSSVESLPTSNGNIGHNAGSLGDRSSRQDREHVDSSKRHKVQPTKDSSRKVRDGKSESTSRSRTESLERDRPLKGDHYETKRRESSRRPSMSSGLSQKRSASSHSLDENAKDTERRRNQSTTHQSAIRRPSLRSGVLNVDPPGIPPPSAMEVVLRSAYLAAHRSSSSRSLVDDPESDISKRKHRNRERRRSMSGSSPVESSALCRTLLGDDSSETTSEQGDHDLDFTSTQQATKPMRRTDQLAACRSSSSRSLVVDSRHKRMERRRSMNCSTTAEKPANKPGCLLGADPAEMTNDNGDCELDFSNPIAAPDSNVTTPPVRSADAFRTRRASMSHTGSCHGGQARVRRRNSLLASGAIHT